MIYPETFGSARLSRRDLLRRGALGGGALALGGLAAARRSTIAPSGPSPSTSASRALSPARAIDWATPESYVQPGMLDPFTKSTGIKVTPDLFSDILELFPKLVTGGTTSAGVIDGSYHSELDFQANLIQPVDLQNVPNYKNLIPAFRNARGAVFEDVVYGVPIAWGTDSIAYRADRVGTSIDSIEALWDPQFAGKIAMPGGIHESLFVSAIHLGFPDPFNLTSDQLSAVERDLIAQKPLVRAYWKQIGDLKNLFATDEVSIAWAWTDVLALTRQGIPMEWANLSEGQLGWYDANYILAQASPEEKLAMEMLMDYTLGDSYGVLLANDVAYRTSSLAAISQMPEKMKQDLNLSDPEGFLANAIWWTAERDQKAYEATWQAVLNS